MPLKKTVKAIAEEERIKKHYKLADELDRMIGEYRPKFKVT